MINKYIIIACFVGLISSLGACIYLTNRFFEIGLKLDNVSSRLASLEKTVLKREHADPLMPSECSIEPELGESRDRPCRITFQRLLQAPHQFHGRWIMIVRLYANGFEESALYSPVFDKDKSALPTVQHYSAVWMEPWIKGDDQPLGKTIIIAKFSNGPSGHMSAYFGKLTDAAVISR